MSNPQDNTNPGIVNVADQGDGLTRVDQPVTVGPGTNPGPLVNTGDQGDGLTSVDQPVTSGPSTNPGPLVNAADQGDGPLSVDQPVVVGPSQSAASSEEATSAPGEIVEPGVTNAGTSSPQSPNTINTTQNTTIGQTYGQGDPTNVFA